MLPPRRTARFAVTALALTLTLAPSGCGRIGDLFVERARADGA